MLDIVVAHYNSSEFENFIKFFTDHITCECNVVIYDKSTKYINKNYNVILSENIGREGETYLNHIIINYENLNEYVLFIQDDTEQHISNYGLFLEQCEYILYKNIQFKLFPSSWRKDTEPIIRTIIDGKCDLFTLSQYDSIKKTCEFHNIYLPNKYSTETCAFFICNKDIILSKSKDFYIKLREWLIENECNGYILEHIWKLIFV